MITQEPVKTTEENADAIVDSKPAEGNEQPEDQPDNPAWMAQLKGDLKTNEVLTQYRSLSDAGEAIIELTEFRKNAVKVPGEDSKEDEWAEFYNKTGRPEKPEDYKFDDPDIKLPEGEKLDEKKKEWFQKFCFDNGLNQNTANSFYQSYVTEVIEAYNEALRQVDNEREAMEAELKKEWAGDYNKNVKLIERVITSFADENAVKELSKAVMGSNINLATMFLNIGKAISEDGFVGGSASQEEADVTVHGIHVFPSLTKQHKK